MSFLEVSDNLPRFPAGLMINSRRELTTEVSSDLNRIRDRHVAEVDGLITRDRSTLPFHPSQQREVRGRILTAVCLYNLFVPDALFIRSYFVGDLSI